MNTRVFALLLSLAPVSAVSAATKSWAGGGAADNFNDAANWSPSGVPANGDDLAFPSTSPATVTNDLPSRTFGSIAITGGITLTGNAFTLTGGITTKSAGPGGQRTNVFIENNITLGADQTFDASSGGTVTFSGNVTFGARKLTVAGSRSVIFQGLTGSGTAGSQLLKTGTGLLHVDTSAILLTNLPFTLSTGTLDVDGFLQMPVTMTAGTLTGEGTVSGTLDATGGDIVPDAGDLSISGAVSLGGSVHLKTKLLGPSDESLLECGGSVSLSGNAVLDVDSTAYTPGRGDSFQLLQKSTTGAISGAFSNQAHASEIVIGPSVVTVSYLGGNGNDLTLTTSAVTRTWDGGATLNDNWTDPDNWAGNVAPQAGDILVFPAGIPGTDRGMDNDFANDTTFRQLVFNGDDFTVRGARFRLTHGIRLGFTAGKANIDVDVALARDQTFDLGSATENADERQLHLDRLDHIETAGHRLTLSGIGVLDALITGSGGVDVRAGTLQLTAPNDYTGNTFIAADATVNLVFGVITLVDAGLSDGRLGSPAGETVVEGSLTASNRQVVLPVPVTHDEKVRLHNGGSLTLDAALALANVEWAGEIILEAAGGEVSLLGSGLGETFYSGRISGSGNIYCEARENCKIYINGSQSNTFTGNFTFGRGPLFLDKSGPGTAAISGARFKVAGLLAYVETRQDEQIANSCHVEIVDDGELKIGNSIPRTEAIGDLTLSGQGIIYGDTDSSLTVGGNISVTSTAGAIAMITRLDSAVTTIDVVQGHLLFTGNARMILRQGAGQARKTGLGKLILKTIDVDVPIELAAGAMAIEGTSLTQLVTLNGGSLLGHGNVSAGLTSLAGGGVIAPGESPGQAGLLRSGPMSLNAATTYQCEVVTNAAGSGYDQISVTGSVNLGGAALALQYPAGFSVSIGATVLPLVNDGTDLITGTFANLPQGTFIPVPADNGGGGWVISYTGGTGNDVALTRVAEPPAEALKPTVTSVTFGTADPNGNRPVTIAAKGIPGASYQLETSVDLFPLPTWTNDGTPQTAAAGTGALSFTTSASPPVRTRQFWRVKKL